MQKKRLMRSRTNRLIGGVLGGLAEYFDWNANLLRVIYVLLSLAIFHGLVGLLLYVILMTIMPISPEQPTSFFGGFPFGHQQSSQSTPDRKVIHDVTEHDHDDRKD